jgi:uncharacterized repeat protein (TIGR03803 family)
MSSDRILTAAIFGVLASVVAPGAQAQKITTLYAFQGTTDGDEPQTGVTSYNKLLYGTTPYGGVSAPCCGTVFSVDPSTHQKTILYSFQALQSGGDGGTPNGLTLANGIFYGTTRIGGAEDTGTLFSFTPGTNVETTLYNSPFSSSYSGLSGIVTYYKGVLYGGAYDYETGVASLYSFKIATSHYKSLVNLPSLSATAGVIYVNGDFYGSASGGTNGTGYLFQFDPSTKVLSVLYSFTGTTDGAGPGPLVYTGSAFYGTTNKGTGSAKYGTIFMLAPPTEGDSEWTLTTLYNFSAAEGATSLAALYYDGSALYGSTPFGNATKYGTIFKYDLSTNQESTLYTFLGKRKDGRTPLGPLTETRGAFYGTTYGYADSGSEADGAGTVFKFQP